MAKTKAQELAGTLRWLADRGVIEGLHPERVREAADLLERQAGDLATANAALAANEHMVEVEAEKLPGYRVSIKGTFAITSPRIYGCEHQLPLYEMEYVNANWRTYLARLLVRQATDGWIRELEEETFKQLCAIDLKRLNDQEPVA